MGCQAGQCGWSCRQPRGKGSAQAHPRPEARGPPFLPEAGLAALGGSDKASEASLHTMPTVRTGVSEEGNLG